MLKIIAIFLGGIAVGAVIIYGVMTVKPVKIAKVSPTPTLASTPTQKKESQDEKIKRQKDMLEKLRQQLYEEGIATSATVDKVFPEIGFTVKDETGANVFVLWNKDSPEPGQKVSIKGTIERASEQIGEIQQKRGFTLELESFLKDHQVFINAKEVTLSP